MANTPYPLPRQTRESTIQVGNGTAGPYGPSLYRVFDVEDVRVYLQAEGEESFADVTDGCTVTKTGSEGYDTFSVTFAAAVPATSRWYHAAKRVSNRSVAVTRAGTLVSDELEKELSKQASALSEMRRDIGRAVKVDPDQDEVWVQPLADGHISVWRDGQMVDGGPVDAIHESADSASASAAAAAISAGNAADSAGAAAGSANAAAGAAISAAGSAEDAAADRALAVAAANSASNSAGAAANDRAAVAIDRAAVADDRDAAAASAGAAAGSANSAANSAGAAADDRDAVAIDRAAVAADRDAAAGSAGAASASAGAAAGSAARADEWANAPENQPVEPGKFSALHWSKKAEEAAGGGMQPAMYDPQGVQDDAFSMDNMAEGTNTKIMTAAERTKLARADATVVGGAIAGVSQVPAPDDGDRFAGILFGGSSLFWTTWGDLKAKLKAYFDTIYQAAGSYVPTTRTVASQHSLQGGGALSANRTLTLVGDVASPGNNKVYGTDGSGARGWYSLPSAEGIGVGQTWQDVKASRAVSTTYQNTTGKPIEVSALINGNNKWQVSENNLTWVTVAIGAQSGRQNQSFIVPNNYYYRHNGTGTIEEWAELR